MNHPPTARQTLGRLAATLSLVAGTGCFAAGDETSIVAVWQYASEVDTHADGSRAPAAALSDTQGLLIYTADGFMSVVTMPKSRRWSTDGATPAQLRETVENGTAYAGRYELDPVHHTITHVISVSMEPQYERMRLVRGYELTGEVLVLTGTFPYDGETIHFAIRWTRMKGR